MSIEIESSRPRARGFIAATEGSIAVEFAVTLPLMATLLLASVEVSTYVWARQRVVDAAAAVGDLTALASEVDETSIAQVFEAAEAMVDADSVGDKGLGAVTGTITAALTCKCGDDDDGDEWCFFALWSHSYDGSTLSEGVAVGTPLPDVPQNLGLVEGSTLIVSDVEYAFSPTLRYVLDNTTFEFSERLYYKPRATLRIDHTGDQAQTPALTCDDDDL